MADLAKLSWNGSSQAVHLPPEYHFDGVAVRIHREGERVILEPVSNDVEDSAETINRLREEVRKGYGSGEARPLDMEAVKRDARAAFERDR